MRKKIIGQKFTVSVAALLLVALLVSAAVFCAPQAVSVAQAEGDPWYYDGAYLDLSATGAVKAAGTALASRASSVDASPIIIAVIDTGLDRSTEGVDWDSVLLKAPDGAFVGYNSYLAAVGGVTDEAVLTDYDNWCDSEGDNSSNNAEMHGTKVAGAIAETIIAAGLEDFVKIYPIKASQEDTSKFTVASVAAAVERATEIGADVINMSLCSSDSNRDSWESGTDAENLKRAITAASVNTILVAAAGNFAKDSASALYYPAAYDNVVGVMSYGKSGTIYKGSSGSNYGAAYDIFAPGEAIESGGYTTTGTSMAACFVSSAAAMLMLNLEVQSAETGASVPRATALSRLLCSVGEGDKTVADPNGATYKAVNLYSALSVNIGDVDAGYLPVTGINITGNTAGGDTLTVTEKNKITVQTVREKYGKGKSLVNLSAELLPEWDVDPSEYANVVWRTEQYTETTDDKGNVTAEESVEGTLKEIGNGQTVQYLFDKAGLYKITASVVGASGKTYFSTMKFNVVYSSWIGSEAHIVPADYVSSEGYIKGTGTVPSSVVSYKSGVSLTITTLEDYDVAEVSWYVDGRFAGNGKVFDYKPEKVGDHNVTAYVRLNDGSENTATYKIAGSFLVDCRSYAEHPGMIAFWCVLGGAAVAAVAALAVRSRKRKAEKAAALAAESAERSDENSGTNAVSPIRKERSTPPPPPEPVKKSKRRK